MAGLVPELGLEGPVLVVDDPEPAVARALAAAGVETAAWNRMDRAGVGPGTPWPPPGPFPAVCLRLPRSREALEFALHAALSVTRPGGRVFVYGANDEGIGSTPGRLEGLVGPVAQRANARRCRVLEGRWGGGATPASGIRLRAPLSAWREVREVDLGWGPIPWAAYPGTFAGGRLDPGTALLLRALPTVPEGARVLDFGAGTGIVAAAVRRGSPGAEVILLEPDALAREAARENVPGARFATLEGWSREGPYRAVVSNPPYHLGKGESMEVVASLVTGSAGALARGGELRLVVQRRLPVEALLRGAFGEVEALTDEGPYRVWRAARPLSS